VPVSDFGFVDEGRRDHPSTRRRGPATVFAVVFVVGLVGLLSLVAWAWSGRLHSDDVAAWTATAKELDELDHSLTPLGHSEIPPCRDSSDGRITRTYPPSTGPRAAELVGALTQKGWTRAVATPPAFARLTRTLAGHEVTIDVAAADAAALVDSLTATSPASGLGCLLR
jgi:hypothetical protein